MHSAVREPYVNAIAQTLFNGASIISCLSVGRVNRRFWLSLKKELEGLTLDVDAKHPNHLLGTSA